jgi:hypothetical protein
MTRILLIILLFISQIGFCQTKRKTFYFGITKGVTSNRVVFKEFYDPIETFLGSGYKTYSKNSPYLFHISAFDGRRLGLVGTAGLDRMYLRYSYFTRIYDNTANHGQTTYGERRGYIIDGDFSFFNWSLKARLNLYPTDWPIQAYLNFGVSGTIMKPQFQNVTYFVHNWRSTYFAYADFPPSHSSEYSEEIVPYENIAAERHFAFWPALGLEITYPFSIYQIGISGTIQQGNMAVLPNSSHMAQYSARVHFCVGL